MKLLVTTVERGQGEKVAAFISEFKTDLSVVFLGEGTASPKVLEYLLLDNNKKDIVISIVDDEETGIILEKLDKEFNIVNKHHGIAYTIRVSAISSLALKLMMNEVIENER